MLLICIQEKISQQRQMKTEYDKNQVTKNRGQQEYTARVTLQKIKVTRLAPTD